MYSFMIVRLSLSAQQDIEALAAIAHPHLRELAQALAQDRIIPPVWLISEAGAL
jgi:hypothetical protein